MCHIYKLTRRRSSRKEGKAGRRHGSARYLSMRMSLTSPMFSLVVFMYYLYHINDDDYYYYSGGGGGGRSI